MYEPYKCYQGLAHAYFEQQAYEQAALAYKSAALDERNPNPGASLVNLGLCMMALGRPKSAAEAYSAALGVEDYPNRGKALANLGMAYYSSGDYLRAQRALEEAQVMHRYQLNPAAASVLASCQEKLAAGQGEVEGSVAEEPALPAEVEQGSAAAPEEAPLEGVGAEPVAPAAPVAADAAQQAVEPGITAAPGSGEAPASAEQDTGQVGPLEEVDAFYELSEKEITKRSKQEKKRKRGVWRWLKPVLIVLLVLAILAGAAVAFFSTGFGVPSINSTITNMFAAYKASGDYESQWVAGSQNIDRQMAAIPPKADVSVNTITPSILSSTAQVTVVDNTSMNLKFTVICKRVGLGWKVSSVTGDY